MLQTALDQIKISCMQNSKFFSNILNLNDTIKQNGSGK